MNWLSDLGAIPLKTNPLDPTINATSKYQENKTFNFGYIKLQKEKPDGKIHLIAQVLDADGLERPGSNCGFATTVIMVITTIASGTSRHTDK